ncbi:Ti-type conjugative transfer relaxase TraA [Legionella londiniensis]|uniref:Ti-type conjugative transfer relaxase TraA n=1 Tax=Legionella londiniensis TaxID=45068 RepID=UPI0007308793|nr:Ti-type conjugative transfer relaxase TraA [Legionella londiniensis]
MAIAFAHVSIHTRAKGHSAIAASAYRSGSTLYDARTGITHDYSNRHDVAFSTVLLPPDAISEFTNREFLWNKVEQAENRRDAQLCKDVVLALPKELNLPLQIELTKQFAQTYFVDNGLPADIAIHDHGDGNPHAHILISTRRLEKDRFSKYKARDLNPAFAKRFIVEKDYWGELWREYQNNFFREHGLELSVDLNHVISERHTGRISHHHDNYLHEENRLINDVRADIVLNPETFIQRIAETHSVFSRRDIERLVFKTFQKTHHSTNYLQVVAQILEHQEVIKLGGNDQGIESYTTRKQYIEEGKLLEHVERLSVRKNHVLQQNLAKVIKQYQLNEEQAQAMQFIIQGKDISVLIGRPGVGKSYLLKPLKELYEEQGHMVLGASLSGKVAKMLQSETGIQASTIASLTYRLKTGKMSLTKWHVLVIDEAGMVDFNNLSFLLKAVDEAGAKIVLVGDPDQLKPIHKGEIFRGIAARTGYIELGNIRRQRDEGDRMASLALARGEIKEAINHYAQREAIHFFDGKNETTDALVDMWQKNLTAESIKQHVMLAFSCSAVDELNIKGRLAAIKNGLVNQDGFDYFSQNGASSLSLAKGERILFRQNNKPLGVHNGDLATITDINANTLTAILDSGEQVIIPQNYKWIDYGYALTVHKSQGMTVEQASVLIDNTYWDKHLAFVAMTRHKEKLQIYANTQIHSDLDALVHTLSRSTTKDNVIDWPLDFALRAGFDSDSLVGKAINYIARTATTIKDKWSYIVNYEAYLYAQGVKKQLQEQQIARSVARSVANLMDESQDLKQQFKLLEKEAKQKNISPYHLPEFGKLYTRSLERDKQASALVSTQLESIEKMALPSTFIEKIKSYADRYNRYQMIEAIAKSSSSEDYELLLNSNRLKIDLSKDYPHIVNIASQYHIPVDLLREKIQTFQQQYRKQAWNNLCKEYPVLAEYEKITEQSSKMHGFCKEQYQKVIQNLVVRITNDASLLTKLNHDHPKIANKLLVQAQSHSAHEQSH